MRHRLRAAGLLAVWALVACTPSPGVEPTPTIPPPQPSPAENSFERQQRLDFEAAENAYRVFQQSFHASMRAGGSLKPTKVMMETATGEYLTAYSQVLEGAKRAGYREVGEARTIYVLPLAHYERGVDLTVCDDASGIKVVNDRGKRIGDGEIRTSTIKVRKSDDSWKMIDLDGKKVSKCDAPAPN